jgi:hypothetical protein
LRRKNSKGYSGKAILLRNNSKGYSGKAVLHRKNSNGYLGMWHIAPKKQQRILRQSRITQKKQQRIFRYVAHCAEKTAKDTPVIAILRRKNSKVYLGMWHIAPKKQQSIFR